MDRFWSKVNKRNSDDCWDWTASKFRQGYGKFTETGKSQPSKAHRVSWEIKHGPLPKGLLICHKCDNPSCVNPEHLFLGTYQDNNRDCADKGRHGGPFGVAHPNTKLTERKVQIIRALFKRGTRQVDLANLFNVDRPVISRIVNNKTWVHVGG